MNYYITANFENGKVEYYPMSAKTDTGARRQAKKIISKIKNEDYVGARCDILLEYHRPSDGCRGILDSWEND